MGLFSRTKQLTSDEYADLLSKLTKLANDISLLRIDVEAVKTRLNSVNGLINRKLGKYEQEEDEEEPLTAQEIQKRLLGMQ